MKRELEEKLYQQFLWLDATPIECDDGWYQLIYGLCQEIDMELKNCDADFVEGFFVEQIKEKFASLRFYTTYVNDSIYQLIEGAETKSKSICELCGNNGYICIHGHYIKTLCDKCKDDNGFVDVS